MGSNRRRREQKKLRRDEAQGNALHFSGPIQSNRCVLRVFLGHPSAMDGQGGVDVGKLVGVDAIIDTGATKACVSHALATRIGLVSHGKTRVGVVGGTTDLDEAPALICFPSSDGDAAARVVPVAIGNLGVPMLFGMSELTPGVLVVDLALGTWDWKVKRGKMSTTDEPLIIPPPPGNARFT